MEPDRERMLRVLAEKAMGWIEVPVGVRQPAEPGYFFVDSDPLQKCCKAGVYYYAQGRWMRDCGWHLWEPDISWPQCGMVIDAMQEKGYALHTSFTTMGGQPYAYAVCRRFAPTPGSPDVLWGVSTTKDKGLPMAICEAIYQALEATDG